VKRTINYIEWVTGPEYGRKTGCEMHRRSLVETICGTGIRQCEEDSQIEGVTGTEYGRKTACEMNRGTVNDTCNETISEVG
jgi:hypothetical protein